MTDTIDTLTIAREYLNERYAGLYNVTRMRDYPDGSRLYGSPLWHTTGPLVSVRVHADGTIHGTPAAARAGHMSTDQAKPDTSG